MSPKWVCSMTHLSYYGDGNRSNPGSLRILHPRREKRHDVSWKLNNEAIMICLCVAKNLSYFHVGRWRGYEHCNYVVQTLRTGSKVALFNNRRIWVRNGAKETESNERNTRICSGDPLISFCFFCSISAQMPVHLRAILAMYSPQALELCRAIGGTV